MEIEFAEFAEKMRLLHEMSSQISYGNEALAVINKGEPGNYEKNPTVEEFAQKGYQLIDANMFGYGEERGEILIFFPVQQKE